MRIQTTKRPELGLSLIELVASVVLFTIIMVGITQHIALTRVLIYHAHLKNAVETCLNNTLISHQNDPDGTNNVPVPAEINSYVPSGTVTVVKTATNITGTIIWTSVLGPQEGTFTNTASLTLVPLN